MIQKIQNKLALKHKIEVKASREIEKCSSLPAPPRAVRSARSRGINMHCFVACSHFTWQCFYLSTVDGVFDERSCGDIINRTTVNILSLFESGDKLAAAVATGPLSE